MWVLGRVMGGSAAFITTLRGLFPSGNQVQQWGKGQLCISPLLLLGLLFPLFFCPMGRELKGQRIVEQRVEWHFNPRVALEVDSLYTLYHFTGATRIGPGAPIYHSVHMLCSGGEGVPYLTSVQYQPLPVALRSRPAWLAQYDAPTLHVECARGEHWLTVTLPAFRTRGGTLEYLTGYSVGWRNGDPSAQHLSPAGQSTRGETAKSTRSTADYHRVKQSLLRSEEWRKIAVPKSGVYRVDYNQLVDQGFPNPELLSVWGGRGGQLSYSNAAPFTDDLQPVPLLWALRPGHSLPGPGDYAMLYLEGPHSWRWDATRGLYMYQEHLHEDSAHYFITTSLTPRTVKDNPAAQQSTPHWQNSYVGLAGYQGRGERLLESGRERMGETFQNHTTKSISSGLTHTQRGGDAHCYIRVLAASDSPSEFSIAYQGGTVGTVKIPALAMRENRIRTAHLRDTLIKITSTAEGEFVLKLTYSSPTGNQAKGWLNKLVFNARQQLKYTGGQLIFPIDSVAPGALAKINVEGTGGQPNLYLWDVTNPHEPLNCGLASSLPSLAAGKRGWAVVFNAADLPSVQFGERVTNQNLHGMEPPELLIITAPAFLEQAERVANTYSASPLTHLSCRVATTEQIYNEFSSGTLDPTALRNFIRMLYWRGGGATGPLQHVLLMGKALNDYRDPDLARGWYLPNHQSQNSWNVAESFGTDDYFGMLDPEENDCEGALDLAIGRYSTMDPILARNIADNEALQHSPASWGPWLAKAAFVADDADANSYMEGSDSLARHVEKHRAAIEVKRLYADAFRQNTSWYSERYPTFSAAINASVSQGLFLFNYIGHGNPGTIAHELFLTQNDIYFWRNPGRRPLFLAASCYLANYDRSPDHEYSMGEQMLFQQEGGAIASIASSRISYAQSNFDFNYRLIEAMYPPRPEKPPRSLGEAYRRAKTKTVNSINKRKFVLLGNPALPLLDPDAKAEITHLNDAPVQGTLDTVRAGQLVKMRVAITTPTGSPFHGRVHLALLGPQQRVRTRNNDGPAPFSYSERTTTVFRGQAECRDGVATVEFPVPLDMDVDYGTGIAHLLGTSRETVATGAHADLVVGGRLPQSQIVNDGQGPSIEILLDGKNSASQEMIYASPEVDLTIRLADSAGINTVGRVKEHSIIANLTHKPSGETREIPLNDFYQAQPNTYRKGTVEYRLFNLKPGEYSLTVRASDALNNSAQQETRFVVNDYSKSLILRALNYPNPFTGSTGFYVETGCPGIPTDIHVEIYTVDGALVRFLQESLVSPRGLIGPITWDGLDQWGQRVGRGVYFYRIVLRNHLEHRGGEKNMEYFGKLLKL